MKRKNIEKSRYLRKNQTDAERKLWLALRNRSLNNIKFRRQYSVGKYILDFYCPEHKIAIEADGGQHYSDEGIKKDSIRSNQLSKHSIKIIRFSDRDILMNLDEVCQKIIYEVEQATPHLSSSPLRGEDKK